MGPVSEFTNLVEEQHGGQQRGRTVGNRHRHPDTQRTEMRRQNKEQRDEEQHLPREGEENRLVGAEFNSVLMVLRKQHTAEAEENLGETQK